MQCFVLPGERLLGPTGPQGRGQQGLLQGGPWTQGLFLCPRCGSGEGEGPVAPSPKGASLMPTLEVQAGQSGLSLSQVELSIAGERWEPGQSSGEP